MKTALHPDAPIEKLTKQAKRLQNLWKSHHSDTFTRIRTSLAQYANASDGQIWRTKARLSECQRMRFRSPLGAKHGKRSRATVAESRTLIQDRAPRLRSSSAAAA